MPTGSQSDARPSSWTSRTVDPFNSWNTVIMPQSRDLAAVSFLFLFILSNLLLVRGDPVRSTSVCSWKPQRSRLWKTLQHFKFKIWPNLAFCTCHQTYMSTFTAHLNALILQENEQISTVNPKWSTRKGSFSWFCPKMWFPSLPDSTVVHSSLAGVPHVLLQGIFRSRILQGDGRTGDLCERHNIEAGG